MSFRVRRADSAPAAAGGGEREIAGDLLRIGRGTNADLRFEDRAVALEHARVERRADGFHLVDLGSVSGTYLNGRQVADARLADGDEIEIGGYRLAVAVGMAADEAPPRLTLTVTALDAAPERQPGAGGPVLAAPQTDYVAAYRLRRPLLTKATLALAALAATAAAVAAVSRPQHRAVFRPGAVSGAHAKAIGIASCTACHAPWRGPLDSRCADCHTPQRIAHQANQAITPPCATCHAEHQGRERLQLVSDRDCVACHADLGRVAGGGTSFAASVRSFADHPELSVTVPLVTQPLVTQPLATQPALTQPAAAGELPRRLRLDSPEGRSADPGTIALDHAKHLAPGLLSPGAPGGRETLSCTSCHVPDASGEPAPIVFESHCARCHQLSFDGRLPEERAPHAAPREVHDYLLGVYSGGPRRGASLRDLRRRRSRLPGSLERSPAEREGIEARVVRAEYDLYRGACDTCHRIDLDARPFPTVAPPAIPGRWLAHARFAHGPHLAHTELACVGCHTRAPASTATADVLMPSIATCQPCHGEAVARERRAPSRCVDCHAYHHGTAGGVGVVAALTDLRPLASVPARSSSEKRVVR